MAAIRVLVVDDSVVIRRLVAGILDEDPEIEVVGTAVNGRAALTKYRALAPDLVTMDVEMPEMDGIEAVRALRAQGSRVPVVMFSTLTERGAVSTFEALAAGASDYVAKPSNSGSLGHSMERVRETLVPLVKSLVPGHRLRAASAPAAPADSWAGAGRTAFPPASSARAPEGRVVTPRVLPATAGDVAVRPAALPALLPRHTPASGYPMLVIGSSTGGPEALFRILTALPVLEVPVAVVQHMPPVFTTQFAARLDRHCRAEVREAAPGQVFAPGTITIAPGDHHLVVDRAGRDLVVGLHQNPPENYCRPAVDVLFRSAAITAGPVLALVLSGMGHDGARGAQHVVDAGGSVLAQDQETSVVWGMPGAVAKAGLAEQLLGLDEVAAELLCRLAPRPAAAPAGTVRRAGGTS